MLRRLTIVWSDFQSRLMALPIIQRVLCERVRRDDCLTLMADHYHQVKEGSGTKSTVVLIGMRKASFESFIRSARDVPGDPL